jgi:hypothetical protein
MEFTILKRRAVKNGNIFPGSVDVAVEDYLPHCKSTTY